MTIQLTIQSKGILCKDDLDFNELLKFCKLNFAQHNSFYVLEEADSTTGILYNPNALARGIYFDGSKMEQGEVGVELSFPTTHGEICDFIRVVTGIKLQYRNIQLLYDGITLSMDDFVSSKHRFLEHSLNTLKVLCQEEEEVTLTMVKHPYTLTEKEQKFFATEGTLENFELFLCKKQEGTAEFACPTIMTDPVTEKVLAVYCLMENQDVIMPILHGQFITKNNLEINRGILYLCKNKRQKIFDQGFDHDQLMELLVEFGAEYYDATHLYLPAFTSGELKEIVKEMIQSS